MEEKSPPTTPPRASPAAHANSNLVQELIEQCQMAAHMPSIHALHPVGLLTVARPEQLLTRPALATAAGDWHWSTTYATDKPALPGFDT